MWSASGESRPMTMSPSAMAQNKRPPSASGENSSVFLLSYSTPAAKAQAKENIKRMIDIYGHTLCFSAMCSRPSYSSICHSTSSGISTILRVDAQPLASSPKYSITEIKSGSFRGV
jgi:hypothetical protein